MEPGQTQAASVRLSPVATHFETVQRRLENRLTIGLVASPCHVDFVSMRVAVVGANDQAHRPATRRQPIPLVGDLPRISELKV